MKNPGRTCTVCNAGNRLGVPAIFVATAGDRMQWFECGAHSPTDNVAGNIRISLTPIDDWFAAIPCSQAPNGQLCQGDYGVPMCCQWCWEVMD